MSRGWGLNDEDLNKEAHYLGRPGDLRAQFSDLNEKISKSLQTHAFAGIYIPPAPVLGINFGDPLPLLPLGPLLGVPMEPRGRDSFGSFYLTRLFARLVRWMS